MHLDYLRSRFAHLKWLTCWIVVASLTTSTRVIAQSGQSLSNGPPSIRSTEGNPPNPNGQTGGAVIADFDTLMNLIMQTIDPDSWLLNGAGTNTIMQYPAGVYVDPKGQMKRIKDAEIAVDITVGKSRAPRHPWRQESKLRTISLKHLDTSLRDAVHSGLQPSSDILKLAGLSRIEYVKIDVAGEDILLAGPAGANQFGFLLEDLATVASLINNKTTPLGCSIEPSDKGLLAAQEMLAERGVLERLSRNPKLVTEQMQEKIGSHQVRVFGMPEGCATAIALLDADEHMKRVGFGKEATSPRIKTYFDFLNEQASIPKQSLIRWWFAFTDESIQVDASGKVFQLPEQVVRVMSEQQWVSEQSGRVPTGASDPAADKFAAEMSEHLDSLRQTHPSYARLCGVFESGLALQLALEANGQSDLRAWFPTLCALGKSMWKPSDGQIPKTVEGLTTWNRLKTGTIIAVVSGGVKLDLAQAANKSEWKASKFLASSVIPTQANIPATTHARWWWD
jgi:Protein of unknown function (DUF1598)